MFKLITPFFILFLLFVIANKDQPLAENTKIHATSHNKASHNKASHNKASHNNLTQQLLTHKSAAKEVINPVVYLKEAEQVKLISEHLISKQEKENLDEFSKHFVQNTTQDVYYYPPAIIETHSSDLEDKTVLGIDPYYTALGQQRIYFTSTELN